MVPSTTQDIQRTILHELYVSSIGGHAGVARTFARIAAQFYWTHMRIDIKRFVAQCITCQQAKHSHLSPAGLLQPLPVPSQIWEDVAMDFIVGLPPSNGYSVIMVVIDRLSKYAHFFSLKSSFTSQQVAEKFFDGIVKLHGIPSSIVFDRDKVFTSSFWIHLFKLQGTTLRMSSSFHPQSDGQSEALNKCLEMYLRCYVFDRPKQWLKYLAWAEYWYNTAFHTTAGMTPFKIVYGRDPPALLRYSPTSTDPKDIQQQLLDRDELLVQLKRNLAHAQARMKKYADSKCTVVQLQLGDMVFIKLQPYRQSSMALRRNQKLGLRYFGPFPVVARIGEVAYRLLLPPTAKIHDVFHISLLKKCVGNPSSQYIPLPLSLSKDDFTVKPMRIVDKRSVLLNGNWVQ